MLSGFLIVPPCRNAAGVTRKPKVFCIGLSRTGTTSITVALHQLGYDAHHQCHALVTHDSAGRPRMSRDWAEAFDVHSDIAPATVFEELAVAYPDARFVLTRREPRIWARAMIRFMGKFRHLFAAPPIARMFADVYGPTWHSYTEDQWTAVYEAHDRKVVAFFDKTPHRLLKYDICQGAGWSPLCKFLGEPIPTDKPFPHADVFELSAFTQIWWQLKRLRARFGAWIMVSIILVLVLRPAVADHGQCNRACRVANADTGSPSVLGATGDWFAPGIGGRRLWSDRTLCKVQEAHAQH